MGFIRSVCSGILSVWTMVAVSQAAEPVYYAFELDGQRIGHAEITADELTLDGQPLQRLRTTTVLKFGMLGTTRTIVRHATTLVQPDTGIPVHYQLTQDLNGTVTHIECQFADGEVQIWQRAAEAAKGDAQLVQLAPGTRILANNDFAHWDLLAHAMFVQAGANAELKVFLPDTAQTEALRLTRGEPQVVQVAGAQRNCQSWRLAGADLVILVDAESGQFLQMDLPAQKTVVRLADAGVAEDTADLPVTDVLARHFAQSNVTFDDFLKVTSVEVKLDATVIGEAVGQGDSPLRTAMQEFDGQREESTIRGTFQVTTRKYVPSEPIPFPTAQPADPTLSAWLQPDSMIESDDANIVALARDLTQGTSQRWEAVAQIANWVHREIRYAIADTPSARMALEKRRGDCGPHATLTVAMLRAVGIPARLVGGLVYAPVFGGTFGQHAWVEIHMGADGWIAFDPTTGEIDSLSATHIKLFEGMGGVIPAQVEVLAFAPANRDVPAQAIGPAQQVAWELGKDYTYTYVQNGQPIGREVFRLQQVTQDGQDRLELASQLEVTAQDRTIKSQTRLVTGLDAIPVLFHREFDVSGTRTTVHSEFAKGTVRTTVSGATALTRDVPLKEGTYCFDNNLIASFALLCTQFELERNKTIELRTFHPSTMTEIPLTFRLKDVKPVAIAGKDVECFECMVEPIKNTFWITRDKRLVRFDAPGLVIEVDR